MKTMNDRIKAMLVSSVLVLSLLTVGNPLFPLSAASARTLQLSQENESLLSASSPFEDLIDYALAGNKRGMKEALKAYEQQAAKVAKVLSEKARRQLENQVSGIRKALQEGDDHAVASHSVEAYGLLVESLNPENLATPKEVALLDYVGFKMRVLMNAQSPDWSAAQSTAEEAKRLWTAIEARVQESGLRDSMNTTIEGLLRATNSRNVEMAVFAAEEDLAQVDLLEKYFEGKAQ